jgi:hypothetical protein
MAVGLCAIVMLGCPTSDGDSDQNGPVYNNTTDRTNGDALYIGSAACKACHPNVAAMQSKHGHLQVLKRIEGLAPAYPADATRAGVPNPPGGFSWDDIAYVVGGYTRKARFVDRNGYLLTNGTAGVDAQWNLEFVPSGTAEDFAPYETGQTTPKPYEYACFACHTTGPQSFDPAAPLFQENRLGIEGTWREAGVQCEACHGPGSLHVPDPQARAMYVNTTAEGCGECHNGTFGAGGTVIHAEAGFIQDYMQYAELRASGGHADFNCVACHDPHAGTNYDAAGGIRNTCTNCHSNQNMAVHEGKTYVRGEYVEPVTCVSCHMPFATKSASSVFLGQSAGRVGDVRTHIFRINSEPVDYTTMFAADGKSVATDATGKAAVTLDFVCLRCHNTTGAEPFRLTVSSAGQIAPGIHGVRQGADAARRYGP